MREVEGVRPIGRGWALQRQGFGREEKVGFGAILFGCLDELELGLTESGTRRVARNEIETPE